MLLEQFIINKYTIFLRTKSCQKKFAFLFDDYFVPLLNTNIKFIFFDQVEG